MPDLLFSTSKVLTYAEAVNAALGRALSDIPETLLFGEDVAIPGGVFGVTKGLARRFGDRVFDTPISESAILGGALGAALVGRRPIVEIMWADFSLVAFDQIVNQAANVRYVTRGELSAPITIRTQQGSGPGACAQHSQSLEALFSHIPGIYVGMPSTPQDAYDMLLTAVYSDDPTIVIENRNLYHGDKVDVRVDGSVQPIGTAVVRVTGTDLTIVTWGSLQTRVIDAAQDAMRKQGISSEVIDLRWMRPYDLSTVLESVRKTGRLLIAHEAHTTGGFGAEVLSAVAETGIELMSAPRRIGSPAARIPAAPSLLEAIIPSRDKIYDAIVSVVRGRRENH